MRVDKVCAFILILSGVISTQLPDGRVIKIGPERFQAPEALFTPVMVMFKLLPYYSLGARINGHALLSFVNRWSSLSLGMRSFFVLTFVGVVFL